MKILKRGLNKKRNVAEKITIVLPIAEFSKDRFENSMSDLVRARTFLLTSCNKMINKDLLHEFIIITKEEEYEKIRNDLMYPFKGMRLKIISENEIIPNLGSMPFIGWAKQQILKLAVSKIIETNYYLTIDADMLFTRKVEYEDLFLEDKPRIAFENYGIHAGWWSNTAKVLGYPFQFDENDKCPSVTPVILKCQLVEGLICNLAEIAEGNQETWYEYLLNKTYRQLEVIHWTEYCMYWLYTMKEQGGLEKHYYIPPSKDSFFLGPSIWDKDDVEKFSEEFIKNEVFNPEAEHFVVAIQSNVNISYLDILTRFKYFFEVLNKKN